MMRNNLDRKQVKRVEAFSSTKVPISKVQSSIIGLIAECFALISLLALPFIAIEKTFFILGNGMGPEKGQQRQWQRQG